MRGVRATDGRRRRGVRVERSWVGHGDKDEEGAECQGGLLGHEIKKKKCNAIQGKQTERRASRVWFKQSEWLLNCVDCFLAPHVKTEDYQKTHNFERTLGNRSSAPKLKVSVCDTCSLLSTHEIRLYKIHYTLLNIFHMSVLFQIEVKSYLVRQLSSIKLKETWFKAVSIDDKQFCNWAEQGNDVLRIGYFLFNSFSDLWPPSSSHSHAPCVALSTGLFKVPQCRSLYYSDVR